MSDEVEIPMHEINWGMGGVSSRSIPESVAMPAEVLERGGDRAAVAFRDEHGNVITAVSDGQGDWNVDFVRLAGLARIYRTQITTVVKGVAYALLASGNVANLYGYQGVGGVLQKAGNAVNAVTSISDVVNYGYSAFNSNQKKEPKTEVYRDMGKALGQLCGMGAGMYGALSSTQKAQAASNFVTFAAIAATGPTFMEKKRAEEEARRLFYTQPGAHLRDDGVHTGPTEAYRSGTDTPDTTTPQATRTNTTRTNTIPAGEFSIPRVGTSGQNSNASNASNASNNTYSGRPYTSRSEGRRNPSGPKK
ncbi:hypothetical protein [Streptomyces sp. NPDC006285]|uniref:hypothetical protein n=1 Tax=Streptomyces sp. NPDC006285 TaxID=3364742 RepID=UPI0036890EF3